MDAPEHRYRIDPEGRLWKVRGTHPKSQEGRPRNLGRVVREDPGPDERSVRLLVQPHAWNEPPQTYVVLRAGLDDQRPKAPTPTPGVTDTLTDATHGNRMVQVTVVERRGPIVLVEHPNGERYFLVLCPVCGADLCKISQAEDAWTPQSLMFRILHPVRCPDCGAALCPQPKPGVVIARAGRPVHQ